MAARDASRSSLEVPAASGPVPAPAELGELGWQSAETLSTLLSLSTEDLSDALGPEAPSRTVEIQVAQWGDDPEFQPLTLHEKDLLSLRRVTHLAADRVLLKYGPDICLVSQADSQEVTGQDGIADGGAYFVRRGSILRSSSPPPPSPLPTRRLPRTASTRAEKYTGVLNKVLVLNTGGTISMVESEDGYVAGQGALDGFLRGHHTFHDPEAYDPGMHGRGLLMPSNNHDFRVYYDIDEFVPTVDSCNMDADDWEKIARKIYEGYDRYFGFVILHGTDTLAYTASALAFMLEDLGKSVIITGSQVPIFQQLTDARENLLGALFLAGSHVIPEVAVYFNHRLLRGCRVTKTDASSYAAFESPNFPPLAEIGVAKTINWDLIFRPSKIAKFKVNQRFERGIVVLRLFPGISLETVAPFLRAPVKGVVLQTYGAGNFPSKRKDLLQLLANACQRDRIIVVSCTQCLKGGVGDLYETGNALYRAGVIRTHDMTPEAALTKLGHILAQDNLSLPEKKALLQKNIRGEMRFELSETISTSTHLEFFRRLASVLQLQSNDESHNVQRVLEPYIFCAAARSGDQGLIAQYLADGWDPNTSDYDSRTPLHLAAAEGQTEIVRLLLEAGAMLHAKDRFGNVPLVDAVERAHVGTIQVLRDAGASLDLEELEMASRMCLLAARDRALQLHAWLLAGADPNLADYMGHTALHAAATAGTRNSIAVLVTSPDIDLNAVDFTGRTAIECARQRNKSHCVDILTAARQARRRSSQVHSYV